MVGSSADQQMPWLTPEELAALPEGSPITVLWSGGNGPHKYHLRFSKWGYPYAESRGTYVGVLDLIGRPPGTAVVPGWVAGKDFPSRPCPNIEKHVT